MREKTRAKRLSKGKIGERRFQHYGYLQCSIIFMDVVTVIDPVRLKELMTGYAGCDYFGNYLVRMDVA
jgi:hypothetical protein